MTVITISQVALTTALFRCPPLCQFSLLLHYQIFCIPFCFSLLLVSYYCLYFFYFFSRNTDLPIIHIFFQSAMHESTINNLLYTESRTVDFQSAILLLISHNNLCFFIFPCFQHFRCNCIHIIFWCILLHNIVHWLNYFNGFFKFICNLEKLLPTKNNSLSYYISLLEFDHRHTECD